MKDLLLAPFRAVAAFVAVVWAFVNWKSDGS